LVMKKQLMLIVWPAFLAACALELLVFAVVDPLELHWGGHALELSRRAAYTWAFFVFWTVSAVACALTLVLSWPQALEASRSRSPDLPKD